MYRSLYPKANVDRLHWKRKNCGKMLISVEECVRKEKELLLTVDENPKYVKTVIATTQRKKMLKKECTLYLREVMKKLEMTTAGYG